jgi:hypothetical protein
MSDLEQDGGYKSMMNNFGELCRAYVSHSDELDGNLPLVTPWFSRRKSRSYYISTDFVVQACNHVFYLL